MESERPDIGHGLPPGIPNGSIHLCQVSDRVSCGACCGLYNVANLSRPSLEALLMDRTEAFSRVNRSVADIERFERAVEGFSPVDRPYQQFHHCAFLGLIGNRRQRVGCLLHPKAPGNHGVDYRRLSFYGEKACRTYWCPSYRRLSRIYQRLVTGSMGHWFGYGLIVTEHRLLAAVFNEVESRLGRGLTAADGAASPHFDSLFRELVFLKLEWPYRRHDSPGPCHYPFENRTYERPPVTRVSGAPPSHYDGIFRELDSVFKTPGELRHAESLMHRIFNDFESVLTVSG
ncbi:MAG: hypothetical protein PVH30_10995 [Desulfobacterales bacterium]|jgi:hypothetical protein